MSADEKNPKPWGWRAKQCALPGGEGIFFNQKILYICKYYNLKNPDDSVKIKVLGQKIFYNV